MDDKQTSQLSDVHNSSRLAVATIAVIGVFVAIAVSALIIENAWKNKHAEIANRGADLVSRIETEINARIASVRSFRAFVNATYELTFNEFSGFAESLFADEVGVHLFGWAPRVVPEQLETFSWRQSFLGVDSFRVQDVDGVDVLGSMLEGRNLYPAAFVYPLDDVTRSKFLGLDLASIPSVQSVIRQSIDHNEAKLSEPLDRERLPIIAQPLIAVYPVYARGAPNFMFQQRRENTLGIVFGVFSIEEIVAYAIRNSSFDDLIKEGGVSIAIETSSEEASNKPIFISHPGDTRFDSSKNDFLSTVRVKEVTLLIGQLPMRIRIVSDLSVYSAPYYQTAAIAAIVIIVLTIILAAFSRAIINREREVSGLVDERTAALEESEQQIRDMADVAADWFWETDEENRLSYISDRFEEVTGLNRNIYLGRTRSEAAKVGSQEMNEKWRKHLENVSDCVPFSDFRYSMPREGDEKVHLSISGKPVFDEEGVYKGYRGSGRDVTAEVTALQQLKESEERLHRYIEELEISRQYLEENTNEMAELAERYAIEKERAEASEKSKSEFLASMSHEIRTPMTGVMGFADMLLDGNLSESDREKVIKIKGATQSLLTIINDILDLSKLDARRLDIEKLDFNLRQTVEECIDLVRERARVKDLYLRCEIDDALPEGINSDPTRVRQVLINLIGNAVKFTHEGGITIKAARIERGDGARLRFSISDSGIGISNENVSRLFDDFMQADASISRRYEGTGLGLAISRRLVNLMGGKIGVDSVEKEGSTFWFELPLVEATSDVTPEANRRTITDFETKRPLHILVAEDNNLNQRIIEATLAKFGHTATIVENGQRAVEAVHANDYDLVLMDVRMPEMSGPEATKAIRGSRGKNAKIPVIALTADAMEEHIREYKSMGMDDCVTKPIDRSVLLETINKVLGEVVHVPVTKFVGGHSERGLGADGDDTPPAEQTLHDDIANFLSDLKEVGDDIEKKKVGS